MAVIISENKMDKTFMNGFFKVAAEKVDTRDLMAAKSGKEAKKLLAKELRHTRSKSVGGQRAGGALAGGLMGGPIGAGLGALASAKFPQHAKKLMVGGAALGAVGMGTLVGRVFGKKQKKLKGLSKAEQEAQVKRNYAVLKQLGIVK